MKSLSLASLCLLSACASGAPASRPVLDALSLHYQTTVAGDYAVQVYKDGHILYVEKWTCTIPDGSVVPTCARVAPSYTMPHPAMDDESTCHDRPSAPPES